MIRPYGQNLQCSTHRFAFARGEACIYCQAGLDPEPAEPVPATNPNPAKTYTVVKFPGGKSRAVARARTTDPQASHLAAAKIPTEKLWERMITIRNLVLANPGQCIRWYTNVLAEQTPAPELEAPGCRDSAGMPKHDLGFYGTWTTLFVQAERHGLIIKINDPLTPTEKLMARSPYPGENLVHVYEANTAASLERIEAERKAYFERLEVEKAGDREARAAAVTQQRRAKRVAKSEEHVETFQGSGRSASQQ